MQQIDAATYTQGPVGPHLVKMTGFMVFGMVAIMAANLIETVYISFLGTQELAALGFSFPIIMLIQSTAMGLSVGASSVVSRKIGEGKHDLG
ncbi:MAG: MATE family efflux transporter, partial [Pseudomonadota bacterium]|nr:MATE family efflux transporter [Pseudomonadota bacterium]